MLQGPWVLFSPPPIVRQEVEDCDSVLKVQDSLGRSGGIGGFVVGFP